MKSTISKWHRLNAALAVILLPIIFSHSATAQTLTEASVRLKWLPQAQFAGFYVAKEKGFYIENGIDLTINPGGPNVLTENLVATGSDTFGLAGGAPSVISSRENGLPVVAIGLGTQQTDFVFVAKNDGPVETIQDFKGHSVSTWFTGANHILSAMLADQGVDQDDVNIQPQQVSVTPFVNGSVDVVTATWYNELNTIRNAVGEESLRFFIPEDYGISIPRDALITSERTLANSPELVTHFVEATIRGWKYAFDHPDEAIDIVMQQSPTLERDHQETMLAEMQRLMTADAAQDHGLYWLDREKLLKTHDLLRRYDVISSDIDIDSAFNISILESIPLADRMP
ncbi:ABC transporter substrate-binding protein [Halomonas sp. QX-2]|jgi:NitT/TauT family transport system substrate-binding protein|uniref:Thiamine pyrimidine synthase n=1 Tax=Vreelandella sedimenti TaxID=2729618 RepID=A0A7Z0SKZ9_9GAMM|nr:MULTISPECIES: ABC transporter substrate-binding protein [Halomonas]NYT71902.1 ABC transporter substrate-binding protein [Halomonas sedimenti]|tara:strand:+ start:134623 stop:135648 length:1026 start_codon:yes stop_codon:yes gene_type:complete